MALVVSEASMPCPGGFVYRWQRPDEKTKLPWMFAMKDDELFVLAGIWRLWYSPDGKSQIESFAIITTEPNELILNDADAKLPKEAEAFKKSATKKAPRKSAAKKATKNKSPATKRRPR